MRTPREVSVLWRGRRAGGLNGDGAGLSVPMGLVLPHDPRHPPPLKMWRSAACDERVSSGIRESQCLPWGLDMKRVISILGAARWTNNVWEESLGKNHSSMDQRLWVKNRAIEFQVKENLGFISEPSLSMCYFGVYPSTLYIRDSRWQDPFIGQIFYSKSLLNAVHRFCD